MYKKTIAVIIMFTIASCSTKQRSGTAIGMISGSIIGAGLGSSNSGAGIAIGAVLGGIAGNAIGKKLDENDKKMIAQTTHNALEKAKTDTIVEWQNPDSGNKGLVKPTKTYQTSSGRYCREYIQEAKIGDETIKLYGTACRQPDGQWQIIKSNG